MGRFFCERLHVEILPRENFWHNHTNQTSEVILESGKEETPRDMSSVFPGVSRFKITYPTGRFLGSV